MHDCPSRFRLAQWRSEDLAPEDQQWVAAHVAECPHCRKAVASLNANASAYESDQARQWISIERKLRETATERHPWFRLAVHRLLPAVGAAAVVTIVVYAMVFRSIDPIRFKGALSCEVIAKRGENQFRVSQGAMLQPEDALRFIVTTDQKGYMLIFSVDAMKSVTSYYPDQGREARLEPVWLPAAGRHVMPGSVVLDDSLGEEDFYMVFSDRIFNVSEVLGRAEREVRDQGLDGLLRVPMEPGMRIERLRVMKAERKP